MPLFKIRRRGARPRPKPIRRERQQIRSNGTSTARRSATGSANSNPWNQTRNEGSMYQVLPVDSVSQAMQTAPSAFTMSTNPMVKASKNKRNRKRLAKMGKGVGAVGMFGFAASSVGEFALNLRRDRREEKQKLESLAEDDEIVGAPKAKTSEEAMLQDAARIELIKRENAQSMIGGMILLSVTTTVAFGGWAIYKWLRRRNIKGELSLAEQDLKDMEDSPAAQGTEENIIQTRDMAALKAKISDLKRKLMC